MFGNSLGVCRKLAKGIGSLPGFAREFAKRRPKLAKRLSGGAEKLAESRDVRTIEWDLARSSLGDSPKESGSSLGMQREIIGKKTRGLAARLSEVAGVCES
ncbi:hypothetical protein B296_00055776 [Ensete ventricosum]|uniref:Uncharacterized protein n=1 Tax=Ensete ventricosum TaxID=4639 RepID=A0A426XBD2_ENSVE|nr:hypothetical protein B296_00055776 [Ensete ventricosum]